MAMLTINVNDRVPTHYCRVCGALWFKGADHWSLVSLHCGKCCDNSLMGNQIVALEDPTGPEPGCQDCAREGRFLCDAHGPEPAKPVVIESLSVAPDRQAAERLVEESLIPALADGVVPDDECVRRLTAAMREADAIHRRVGGGTRHYVRDCLLPILDRHGITIAAAPSQPVKGGMSGWCRGEGCVHQAFGEPIWKSGDNPFMTAAQPIIQASGGGVAQALDSVFVIERQDGTPFYRDDAMGILATDSEAQAVRFQYAREEEGAVIARYNRDVMPWAHPDALPDRHAMHAAEAGEHGGENE